MPDLLLSGGHVAQIDIVDVGAVAAGRWYAVRHHGYVYAAGRPCPGKRKVMFLSRFLLAAPPGSDVLHENGDRLDFRRANLRLVQRSETVRRSRPDGRGRSTYRGVSWHALTGRWRASIQHGGGYRWLGLHDTEEEAAMAYDLAAIELFGEDAALNANRGPVSRAPAAHVDPTRPIRA